ncbi:MAG: virulence RhuM family protein [Lachnospiraceae bacterium]
MGQWQIKKEIKTITQSEIIIYQTEDGNTKIDVKFQDETVWLTQAQLCELYQTSKSNISEHIKHIFEEGELEEASVVRNFRTTGADGKNYNIIHYNLDMIISLGYRVKSLIATQFRRWAAEVIYERANAEQPFMGLKNFSGDFPTIKEIGIAKNYLSEEELKILNNIVSGYFDFAEIQAMRHNPMYMSDYAEHLDNLLKTTGEKLLQGAVTVSHAQAIEKATEEYKKYQIQNLSPVEEEYLESIKNIHSMAKKKAQNYIPK